ncbi:hypothetical protein [Microcella sp.]|uniref:hypothetical protein n=1 Tax=Microcella sp. TaxID=1913979 RepID=UPI00256D97DB|nr:hypothetical protein [Microcella sp.]MBX9471932.1 hypothetical protein [Microcella sp.]
MRRRVAVVLLRAQALVAAIALAVTISPSAAHAASVETTDTISSTIGSTNVTPTWGPQTPKIVYDGSWYYTVTLDGSGTSYPWLARIWKSSDGETWTLAQTLGSRVYQAPGLILDSGNRLWLYVPCFTGGECYPGVTTLSGGSNQYVYLQRLQFTSKLGDGSFNFSSWNDHSIRTTTAERYYGGLAIDPNRRYIYHAYSVNGWGLKFSTFDTWNNTETTSSIATPGSSPQEAYLYPRVRPGTSAGEVWMLFTQNYVGISSTSNFGVQLWRSADGGATWSAFMVASCPSPDDENWCDAADLVIDSNNVPHVLYFTLTNDEPHLYYWKGSAGSVTLTGSPTDLGPYDNHSQIAGVGTGEKFVFGHEFAGMSNDLVMLRDNSGGGWTDESFDISGFGDIYSPNLLRPESGTFHSQGSEVFSMIMAASASGTSSPYTSLLFTTVEVD